MPSEVQGTWLPIPGDLYGNGTFGMGSARKTGDSPQFKSADGAPTQSKLQMKEDQAWWVYRLFILKGDVEPSTLVPGEFVTLSEDKSFSENSPPDLDDVTTPLEDTDTSSNSKSPYAPNISTDQTSDAQVTAADLFGVRTAYKWLVRKPIYHFRISIAKYELLN